MPLGRDAVDAVRRRHRWRPAVVGYLTIKYFLRFLAAHRLDVFAYYRLALAAVTVVWLVRWSSDLQWLPAQLHRGLLRHRPARHQRRGVRLDLPAGRRRSSAPLYDRLARAARARASASLTTALLVLLVGARRDQRHRQAAAAARRELPAARAGLPDDLRAGEAAGRRLLPGQRVRVQARGAGRGRGARLPARLPDAGVHGRPRPRARSRWWRSTCRPTTSIWATSSSVRATRPRYPDITVEQGIRIFLTGGMALLEPVPRPARRRSGRRISASEHRTDSAGSRRSRQQLRRASYVSLIRGFTMTPISRRRMLHMLPFAVSAASCAGCWSCAAAGASRRAARCPGAGAGRASAPAPRTPAAKRTWSCPTSGQVDVPGRSTAARC